MTHKGMSARSGGFLLGAFVGVCQDILCAAFSRHPARPDPPPYISQSCASPHHIGVVPGWRTPPRLSLRCGTAIKILRKPFEIFPGPLNMFKGPFEISPGPLRYSKSRWRFSLAHLRFSKGPLRRSAAPSDFQCLLRCSPKS